MTAKLLSPFRIIGPVLDAFVDVVEPLVASFSGTRRVIAVDIDDSDVAFYQARGRKTTFIGKGSMLGERERRMLMSKHKGAVELRLSSDTVIAATLKVPTDGLAYVDKIVESRLDRLTPWAPEKLLYGFAAAAKAGADGQVDVDFAATSRDIAAIATTSLARFGLAPSRLGSAAEPIGQPLRIDLLRGQSDTARNGLRRRIAVAAVAVPLVCLLAFGAGTILSLQSAARLAALDDTLAKVRQRVVQGSGTTSDRERDTALIADKTPDTARFLLIDRLARIIPDNTFLDELDIEPESVRIAGTSSEASALIRILESEPGFTDAKFSAPVTRQDDGRDRFDITATRAPKQKAVAP